MIGEISTFVYTILTVSAGTQWCRAYNVTKKNEYNTDATFNQALEIPSLKILETFENDHMEKVPLIQQDHVIKQQLLFNNARQTNVYPISKPFAFDNTLNFLKNFTTPFTVPHKPSANRIMTVHDDSDETNSKKERFINIVQNWWPPNPFQLIHWIPKFKEYNKLSETDDQDNIKSATTKLSLMQKEITEGPPLHISDKIKRLLNLFSIVKFDNVQCDENGVGGVCLHRLECEKLNGKYNTTCAQQLGVCCHLENAVEKTCGENSKETTTYFVNQEFIASSSLAVDVCSLTLDKADPNISQFRIEFLEFQLREPTNGTCFHDRLVVTGQNADNIIPDICGFNTGQHIYADVDASAGPFKINVITVGEQYPRSFRIKIIQLGKEDERLAPKHCLQYYTESTGTVESFNYRKSIYAKTHEILNGYFNNLNYVICIKKTPGFCSISYENVELENWIEPTFQMINLNEVGDTLLLPRQAGAESFDCPQDYIIVGGTRFCGEKLNDGFIDGDLTKNYPIVDNSNGPFMLSVRTDGYQTGKGFSLTYRQHPCLV